jgi:hypothetical protein
VNAALPIVADIPQKNVAVAMYRYPRPVCVVSGNLGEEVGGTISDGYPSSVQDVSTPETVPALPA